MVDAARGLAVAALTADLLRRLDEQFLRSTMPHPMPTLRDIATDTQEALLFEIKRKIDRLNWLEEGPDTYDAIDVNVTTGPTETRIDYSPFLVWGVSLLNTAAAGGSRVSVRFTDGSGKTKQIPILANSSLDISLKGGLNSVLRMVAATATVNVTGVVLLKWPLYEPNT